MRLTLPLASRLAQDQSKCRSPAPSGGGRASRLDERVESRAGIQAFVGIAGTKLNAARAQQAHMAARGVAQQA